MPATTMPFDTILAFGIFELSRGSLDLTYNNITDTDLPPQKTDEPPRRGRIRVSVDLHG